MYHSLIEKKISQTAALQLHSHSSEIYQYTHKFIFYLIKDRAYTEMYRDHDVISYLHHTVVTMAEPASPPLCSSDSHPNFTVNKSRTVRIHKSNKFGFIRHHASDLIVYS